MFLPVGYSYPSSTRIEHIAFFIGADMRRVVLGVGINDADYKVLITEVVNGKNIKIWSCPFYACWSRMIRRCYSKSSLKEYPSYTGCSVSKEWLRFSAFKSWMERQQWHGNHLDKDILIKGNKVYSEDRCVFVSHKLNTFMLSKDASRGEHPIGVHFHKTERTFMANCNNPFTGKREYLGSYTCPQEAHEAWRKRKHEHACRYADMQTDQRIAEALRKRYAKSGGQDE